MIGLYGDQNFEDSKKYSVGYKIQLGFNHSLMGLQPPQTVINNIPPPPPVPPTDGNTPPSPPLPNRFISLNGILDTVEFITPFCIVSIAVSLLVIAIKL